MKGTRLLVFMALFLAVAVLWQSLRFFVPALVGPWHIFIVGSLVKTTEVCAMLVTRRAAAAGIAFLLPVIAFLQGQLPVPPLVPIVGLGGALYALLAWRGWESRLVWLAPLASTAVFYGGAQLVIRMAELPPIAAYALGIMFGWPQLVTGVAGIVLARWVFKRLHFANIA